ncbi:PA2778 family cysteine peptidase [Zoogloea sp.]|uniref:PA2778 family cysteine peptidase n=1 Tax=Zoogloea sp. TaxID=49181 RepID=UPI0031FE0F8A
MLCLVLSGCASLDGPSPDYRAGASGQPPSRVELSGVPFHPQDAYQCGPAALAMVFGSAGVERTPGQLGQQVYLPLRRGSLQVELLAATRRAGLVPYRLAPRAGALLEELAAGNPVLVLQNLRFDAFPQWHYAVVVGYDLAEGRVILRSGSERRLVMPIADFDRSWAKGGRWAFVALPPERLPASATEADYVSAVADLERVSPAAAGRAYGTALRAWPTNLFAHMALGNAAYRRHEPEVALEHYRQALREHPDAADAWNNLAQVLHETGKHREALQAAERAVAAGGPRQDTYAATLMTIRAAAAR